MTMRSFVSGLGRRLRRYRRLPAALGDAGAMAGGMMAGGVVAGGMMVGGMAAADPLTGPLAGPALAPMVPPPFSLGEPVNDKGVWTVLNSGGAPAGYVFETAPLAPLPGFAGAPINALVTLDLDGRFLSVRLLAHNEPIFVSGLGEAPFHRFFDQYRGHAISDSMVVGTPYGKAGGASSLVYLDGVTKATASVRIAHESVLAATLAVAREKMQGLARAAPAHPDPDHDEALTWSDLVARGLVTRKTVSNAEIQAAFADTIWRDDDPDAADDPSGVYLDLWIADLGPPAIARAVLSADGLRDLQAFMAIADHDEPILVLDTGRHGLVSDDFVRNTSPDWLAAEQDGLPVALRDADLMVDTAAGVPAGTAMILRTDRRLGFDPSRPWDLTVLAVRSHGSFQPRIGTVTLTATHATDPRFFIRPGMVEALPPWAEALRNRASDLVLLGGGLAVLVAALGVGMRRLAGLRWFTPLRLVVLALMVGFVGWWGQGQLSIATVLGVLRAAREGGSIGFLLYDPFSLLIWSVVVASFVAWGRGFFCGWLCPFGALQEFAHHGGRLLRLPTIEPGARLDRQLKRLKYGVLAGLVATVLVSPDDIDLMVEVEPFKTAITVLFVRDWYYVLYAVAWLVLGLFLFKGFCRYVCPLGAVMAIGGLLRRRAWIARRDACGSPCQLCKVECKYGAIRRDGAIDYAECFQCLDCVSIHDDARRCVPLVLAARPDKRGLAGAGAPAQGAVV